MFFTFILLLVWLLLTDNRKKKKGHLWNCKPEKTHKYVPKEKEKKKGWKGLQKSQVQQYSFAATW